MRILHVTQSVSGGIASYFEEIADFQTRLFGANAVRFLIPAKNLHHLPAIDRAQILEFAPFDRSARGLLALGLATYREIGNFKPDVVHLHSTFAGAIARPLMLPLTRKPIVIYCAHGWVFAREAPKWRLKLFSIVERSLVPLTDKIVNISHSDHELACSIGISPHKMVTVRNGIAAIPPSTHQLGVEFPTDRINLIFVGRHDRQKGLDLLLDVFCRANLPSVHLHVIGAPVVDSVKGAKAGKMPNVTFYGWQTRDAVSELLALSDALIMPSRWEGFGLTALEAMRLAKPVIASRRGALTEIIEHGRTGIHFDIDSPSELEDVLRGLDKGILAEMGRAAFDKFMCTFTSEALNAELANLYQSLHKAKLRPSLPSGAIWRDRLDKLWTRSLWK